jgi:hypothetical protein
MKDNTKEGKEASSAIEDWWCNPLVPFVAQVIQQFNQSASAHGRSVLSENVLQFMYMGLLMGQARLAALLVPTWDQQIRRQPEHLARTIVQIVKSHPDLYPPTIPDWAEQHEEQLESFAATLKAAMRFSIIVKVSSL